ncbi:MAG: CDP-glucose 4,6-dehydratase [Elainella sp.]
MVNREFWQGKKVFMTGHTGFKGSWLSLWLQELGAELTGFALKPPSNPSLFELANVASGMTSIEGDICDFEALKQAMAEAQPEIVIHMAAQPIVRRSYQAPIETYATNVMGTVHLLEAVRQVGGVKVVVDITSDKCYENKEWVWGYREDDRLGGYDPYSSSKACAELVAASYRNSFFNPAKYEEHGVALATTRAGNVIGGGDWAADRLIPDILNAVMKGESVLIRSPRATRPWQHVLEPLNGYLMLAERLYSEGVAYAESWNFGPDDLNAKPVSWIADELYELWGNGITWTQDGPGNLHENTFLKLDCTKAHTRLGWLPKLDIKATLQWIVEWSKAYERGLDMRQYTESQIRRFMELGQPGLAASEPSHKVAQLSSK